MLFSGNSLLPQPEIKVLFEAPLPYQVGFHHGGSALVKVNH